MSYYEPEPKLMYEAAEQADPILKVHNQSAPRWLQGETHMGYRRRLAEASITRSELPRLSDCGGARLSIRRVGKANL
jgi:hypothetical protein